MEFLRGRFLWWKYGVSDEREVGSRELFGPFAIRDTLPPERLILLNNYSRGYFRYDGVVLSIKRGPFSADTNNFFIKAHKSGTIINKECHWAVPIGEWILLWRENNSTKNAIFWPCILFSKLVQRRSHPRMRWSNGDICENHPERRNQTPSSLMTVKCAKFSLPESKVIIATYESARFWCRVYGTSKVITSVSWRFLLLVSLSLFRLTPVAQGRMSPVFGPIAYPSPLGNQKTCEYVKTATIERRWHQSVDEYIFEFRTLWLQVY